jgi:hypothetical protein
VRHKRGQEETELSQEFQKFTDPQMVVSSPKLLLADVQKLIFVNIAILDNLERRGAWGRVC